MSALVLTSAQHSRARDIRTARESTRPSVWMDFENTLAHSFNPTWHETKFLLINSLAEVLTMDVMDYNEHRKDSELGSATFELDKLQEDATLEGIVAPVIRDGKSRGELRFDV
jgi:Ca2+-dependent lipid-binding protein